MRTREEIALREGIGIRISEGGGVTVVCVSTGNGSHAMNRTIYIARDGGAAHLARMLPHMPGKLSAKIDHHQLHGAANFLHRAG